MLSFSGLKLSDWLVFSGNAIAVRVWRLMASHYCKFNNHLFTFASNDEYFDYRCLIKLFEEAALSRAALFLYCFVGEVAKLSYLCAY